MPGSKSHRPCGWEVMKRFSVFSCAMFYKVLLSVALKKVKTHFIGMKPQVLLNPTVWCVKLNLWLSRNLLLTTGRCSVALVSMLSSKEQGQNVHFRLTMRSPPQGHPPPPTYNTQHNKINIYRPHVGCLRADHWSLIREFEDLSS